MTGVSQQPSAPTAPSLTAALRAPRATLAALAHQGTPVPWRVWAALTLIAVAGSALYGASIAHAAPGIHLAGSALWLTLSAGLSWLVLGPALIAWTRLPPRVIAHACLVTMAYGEGVLLLGAALNTLAAAAETRAAAVPLNVTAVTVANAVMAAALAAQLRPLGVRARGTLAVWLIALNGTGLLLAWRLSPLLQGSAGGEG